MVDLIIFDCDGVLIDTERIATEVDARELSARGIPMTSEILSRRFAGVPYRDMYRILEAEHGVAIPAEHVDRVKAMLMDAFAAEEQNLAIPGVHAAIDALAGRTLCVASSSSHEWLRATLQQVGLWRYFAPNVFSAADVPRGKPAPDIFLHAAANMNVAPEACLVIEDSVAGVQAGRAAGMTVLGFCGGGHCRPDHRHRLVAAGAAAIFDDMADLAVLISAQETD